MVVFSHLRWNFVFQRPQHLLTRLAEKRRVIYIEEPQCESNCSPYWRLSMPRDRLLVCTPITDCREPGFAPEQIPLVRPMLRRLLRELRALDSIAWFYTPMALPLLRDLAPALTVYDCMDELAKFRFAPRTIRRMEKALFDQADIVFTGGPSLYNAKRRFHANVHCFPSSVDSFHFGKSLNGAKEPPDQRMIPRPRLGFFGVIDERLDLALLEQLARQRPQWQFVLVGPVAKIDEAELPRLPNLHYLGQRAYEQLPDYLAGWDACLLPFARNEATKFISPTKTLEYMAAERPIISTPITDVAEPYGEIVYLGGTPAAFLKACEQALESSAEEREERKLRMRQVLASTSWEKTVRAMEREMTQALRRRNELVSSTLISRRRNRSAARASQWEKSQAQ